MQHACQDAVQHATVHVSSSRQQQYVIMQWIKDAFYSCVSPNSAAEYCLLTEEDIRCWKCQCWSRCLSWGADFDVRWTPERE